MATTIYRQPKSVPVGKNNGYPNNVANTQTMKIRGTDTATQGTKFNPTPGEGKPSSMSVAHVGQKK